LQEAWTAYTRNDWVNRKEDATTREPYPLSQMPLTVGPQIPALFERYRPAIDQMLRRLVPVDESIFTRMLRYHLGWVDAAGHSAPGSTAKALRPTLCLIACEAVGGDWERALPAAAGIELIHNFSLVHDDVQDGDTERRHRPTVWAIWGQAQAINAGDALFALGELAIHQLTETGYSAEQVLYVWRLLNEACLRLIEGQHMDLAFEQRLDISVQDYLAMIDRKTGALIESAMHIGAYLGTADRTRMEHLRRAGAQLGRAFQIGDDILGIWGADTETGKPTANDVRRHKKTFPIIYALEHAHGIDRDTLVALSTRPDIDESAVVQILQLLEHTGARTATRELAAEACTAAMTELEAAGLPSWAMDAFAELATFLLDRHH
jgi:geranylgeranyl diphosphate synthase type I